MKIELHRTNLTFFLKNYVNVDYSIMYELNWIGIKIWIDEI